MPDEHIPGSVSVQPLTAADPPALREIAALTILAWGREPTAEEIEKRSSRLKGEVLSLDPDAAAVFVARRAGVVVGFGRVMREKADASQWLLFALAVHPDHRRQGIGTALARALMEYARQRGARCIRSETHVDNAVSIRYHESMGFRCEGVVTAPDGDRLVRFQLPLG